MVARFSRNSSLSHCIAYFTRKCFSLIVFAIFCPLAKSRAPIAFTYTIHLCTRSEWERNGEIGNHWAKWKKYVFTSVERNDSNLLFAEWPKIQSIEFRAHLRLSFTILPFFDCCLCECVCVFFLLFAEDRAHFSFSVAMSFWLFISPLYLCHSSNFQSIYTVRIFFSFFFVYWLLLFFYRGIKKIYIYVVYHNARELDRLTHSIRKYIVTITQWKLPHIKLWRQWQMI